MNKEQYLERLQQLADELHKAGNARPYNPDEYNRIVDELNALMNPRTAKPKSKWILRIWRTIKKRASVHTRLKG